MQVLDVVCMIVTFAVLMVYVFDQTGSVMEIITVEMDLMKLTVVSDQQHIKGKVYPIPYMENFEGVKHWWIEAYVNRFAKTVFLDTQVLIPTLISKIKCTFSIEYTLRYTYLLLHVLAVCSHSES